MGRGSSPDPRKDGRTTPLQENTPEHAVGTLGERGCRSGSGDRSGGGSGSGGSGGGGGRGDGNGSGSGSGSGERGAAAKQPPRYKDA